MFHEPASWTIDGLPSRTVSPPSTSKSRFRLEFAAAHEYAHWLLREIQAEEFSL